MSKSSSDALAPPGISPVRGNSKHFGTPLKFRRKNSRKDQATDVHTSCSTPNRLLSGNPCTSSTPNRLQAENLCTSGTLDSPSDSFPASQDNRPDVIWDYTSPKLPKGAKKKEIKITVDEFLKSIKNSQNSECHTQNSHYIRLLEKWMAKQNTPVIKKPPRAVKRDYKMRSRRVFEDIKQFMASIQAQNEEKAVQNIMNDISPENSSSNAKQLNESNTSLNKQSFLEGDENENDSLEELWGEADNSFIVKATQHLEVSSLKYNSQNKHLEVMSTIPETIPNTNALNSVNKEMHHASSEKDSLIKAAHSNILNCVNKEAHRASEKDSLTKARVDSDYQAQLLFTQIMSCDWDSDSDFEDFEKGFIMGDDDLSLIPDEVLSGTVMEQDKVTKKTNQFPLKSSSDNTIKKELKSSSSDNRSCEISFGCSESNNATPGADALSEVELFNNFEDESFGDESILCKPEVLSWIDEVENKLSQSQKSSPESSQGTKCTAKEIEKKKSEALQRLKRNRQQKK